MRAFRPVFLCGLAVLVACAASGGPVRGGEGAEGVEGHPRLEFVSWSLTKDRQGAFVPAAQVRVRSLDEDATRDFWVKPGDWIGTREPGGIFSTGMRVAKIDKGLRPIRAPVGGTEGWVLVETYYLLAREASGRSYVVWVSDGRKEREAGGKGKR